MPIEHILYIPVIFLLGASIGFRFGVRRARIELERREEQRKR